MLAFELMTGYAKTFYMTWDEIMAHAKRYSKSFGDARSPWTTETQKMARKTVLRLGLTMYGYFDPFDFMVLQQDEQAVNEDEELPAPEEIGLIVDEVEPEEVEKKDRQQILSELGF